MSARRIVITGRGAVTAVGTETGAFLAALDRGTRAGRPAQRVDTSACDATLAAEIVDFDVQPLLRSRKAYLDLSAQFALGAVSQAIADAGLDDVRLARAGLCLGTAFGSMETLGTFFEGYLEKGPRFVKPFLFQHTYPNTAISLAAIEFGIGGAHLNAAGGLVVGGNALVLACDLIATGVADVVIAGGYDALSDYAYAGLDQAGCLTQGAERGPDDAQPPVCGEGIVPGEGAGMLVLESLDSARGRGATVLAEIVASHMGGTAGGATADAAAGIDAALGATCGQPALEGATLLLASANGSAADTVETTALAALAGDRPDLHAVALKALTGEPFAAGAPLQAIAGIAALSRGRVPGGLPPAVGGANGPTASSPTPVSRAVVLSADPGGSVCALALRPAEGAS